ncbi:MAG: signal peptidase I [Ruminococcus sp.]|nr:signal peptidase I [Ruminococcus sp.]
MSGNTNAGALDKNEKSFSLVDELLDWVEAFVLAIFVVVLIFIFFLRIVEVSGPSMNPTLNDKDRLILTHLNYTPERGDIIVANSKGLDKCIIKRCIGIAGDTVVIDYNKNSVTVNGTKVQEDYLGEAMRGDLAVFDTSFKTANGVYTYHVPEDTIFAIGDNRNHSTDSRSAYVGFIKLEDVLGKAFFRFLPFGSFGSIS